MPDKIKEYAKSGDEEVNAASQGMYDKNEYHEGNMGHNLGGKGYEAGGLNKSGPTGDYEPTHLMDKKNGEIQPVRK